MRQRRPLNLSEECSRVAQCLSEKCRCSRVLTAVSNDNRLLGDVVSATGVGLNGIEHIATTDDVTEDDVSSVEVRSVDEAEEELGAVRVWASVGHGEDTSSSVLVDEVLVSEVGSVDRLATSAVSFGKVATLSHEASDDTMEGAALEGEILARMLAFATLSSAELAEVLRSLGSVVK